MVHLNTFYHRMTSNWNKYGKSMYASGAGFTKHPQAISSSWLPEELLKTRCVSVQTLGLRTFWSRSNSHSILKVGLKSDTVCTQLFRRTPSGEIGP